MRNGCPGLPSLIPCRPRDGTRTGPPRPCPCACPSLLHCRTARPLLNASTTLPHMPTPHALLASSLFFAGFASHSFPDQCVTAGSWQGSRRGAGRTSVGTDSQRTLPLPARLPRQPPASAVPRAQLRLKEAGPQQWFLRRGCHPCKRLQVAGRKGVGHPGSLRHSTAAPRRRSARHPCSLCACSPLHIGSQSAQPLLQPLLFRSRPHPASRSVPPATPRHLAASCPAPPLCGRLAQCS